MKVIYFRSWPLMAVIAKGLYLMSSFELCTTKNSVVGGWSENNETEGMKT